MYILDQSKDTIYNMTELKSIGLGLYLDIVAIACPYEGQDHWRVFKLGKYRDNDEVRKVFADLWEAMKRGDNAIEMPQVAEV